MSNLMFTEGWDAYNGVGTSIGMATRWTISNGNTAMATGRFGGQSMNLNPSGTGASIVTGRAFANTINQFCLGVALEYNYGSIASTYCQLMMRNAANYQLGLRLNTDGSIAAYRMSAVNAGTLLGTSAAAVVNNTNWQYLEWEGVIDATVGRVTVYLDSVQVLNLTGINTDNAGGVVDRVAFAGAGSGFSGNIWVDDIYVIDAAAKLGECKIETIRPNADTAIKQLTPLSGTSNYAMVNATIGQTANYNSGATAGLEDVYDLVNLTSTPASVFGVQVGVIANKTDAGTKQFRTSVNDGAGLTYSDVYSLGSTALFFPDRRLMQNKPSGGAWTYTDVNALQAGLKVEV